LISGSVRWIIRMTDLDRLRVRDIVSLTAGARRRAEREVIGEKRDGIGQRRRVRVQSVDELN